MRIALVNLTGGSFSGGYIKYLQELIPALRRQAEVKELFIFLPPAFNSLLEKELAPEAVFPCRDTVGGHRELQTKIGQLSPDVVFFPTYRWLNFAPIPSVTMIRNMEPLLQPWEDNSLVDAAKNVLRAYAARRSCRQASRVIAVSHFVKDFLAKSWRIPADKIGVVSHGVTAPGAVDNLPIPQGLNPAWAGDFWFTAGSIRPYRGLEDIVGALGRLAAQGQRFPLVIAGAASRLTRSYQRKIEIMAAQLGVAEQVYWAGHLAEAEMSWCFYNSKIFLMTSRIEACPNIALEAMSHGCLCLAADNPPLPEFFGEAAIYYEARQADSLVAAVTKAVSLTPEENERRRARARGQARKFTWEKTAKLTIKEWQLAVGH